MSVTRSHFNQLARERGSRENVKHCTEVTEAIEGGLDGSANFLAGTPRAECENHAKTKKHRTEVAEGGSDWSANFLAGTPRAECENHAKTKKHRTEVTEVAEGIGLGGEFSGGKIAG
jgi:hypothetical protein